MKYAHLGLRVFAVMVVALAPAFIMLAAGWPGALSAAHFALVGAAAGTVVGGPRFGVIVTITIAIAAVIAMPLGAYPWAIAAVMVALGGIYGFWAAHGYASGAMLIPALVPYLVRDPPGIFSSAVPTIDIAYLAAFLLIFIVTGAWTTLVMSRLVLKGYSSAGPSQPTRPTVMFGLFLGAIAGLVVAVAAQIAPNSEWAWITLTMFILANPSGRIDPRQVTDRVIGTVLGLAAALLLSIPTLNSVALGVVTLLLIVGAVVVKIEKKDYWIYVMILTPAIILMDSGGTNTEAVAEQRLLFTLLGIAIIIGTTLLANLVWSRFLRRHPQDAPAAVDSAANNSPS